MLHIRERPYQLLFITALLVILLSAFTGKGSLDIWSGDGVWVIDGVFVLRVTGLFLLLSGLLYRVTRQFMFSNTLIWLHVIITLLVVLCLTVVLFKNGVQHPQRYSDLQYSDWPGMSLHSGIRFVVPLCITVMIVAQVFFIINLLLGVIRKLN